MSIYYINEKLNKLTELLELLSDALWSEDGMIPLGGSKEAVRNILNEFRDELDDIEGTVD